MKRKLVAAVVLLVVLANCSFGRSRPSPSLSPDVRAYFQAVRAAHDKHQKALRSIIRLRNPYGSDGIAAIGRMRQSMDSVEEAAEVRFSVVGPPQEGMVSWGGLAGAVRNTVRTLGMSLSQELPRLKKSLRAHQPISRAASALLLPVEISDVLAAILGNALTELDRWECEAAGGQWDYYDNVQGEDCL